MTTLLAPPIYGSFEMDGIVWKNWFQDTWNYTTTLSATVDTLSASLSSLTTTVSGKVAKAGDTMTGPLSIGASTCPILTWNTTYGTGAGTMAEFRFWNTAAGATYTRMTVGELGTNVGFIETATQASVAGDLVLQPNGGRVGVSGATPPSGATGSGLYFGIAGLVSSVGTGAYYGQNLYYDGNFRFVGAAPASVYYQSGTQHIWYKSTAGSPAAGGLAVLGVQMQIDGNDDLIQQAYTQLGSGAPKIATKKLTVTSANAQGGAVTVAHGLTGAKIISFTAKLEYAANGGVPPEYTFNAGYQYSVYHDATNFTVQNSAANSIAILSKNVIIYVTYER